ncbi:MAG TPA: sulfurtransferase TusA family protein [Gammaproteobacteria bacterium]|jgi:tRNA 2-thiouridine synthesizing protein A
MTADVEIDARRLFCPLPVIKLQDCIRRQVAGTRVRIVSTDPGSLNDIPTWCRISGHRVLDIDDRETEFVFLVEKGANEE